MIIPFTKFYPIGFNVNISFAYHIQTKELVTLIWFCDFAFPYKRFLRLPFVVKHERGG